MFEGEEYWSYIALCRELRLERELEEGDWFLWEGRAYPLGFVGPMLRCHHDEPDADGACEFVVPLPRLDQWLTKIRERGGLRNVRLYYPVTVEDDFVAKAYFADDSTHEARARDCVEEAAARLWMALTGRTVTA